jgi:hypothetical protein
MFSCSRVSRESPVSRISISNYDALRHRCLAVRNAQPQPRPRPRQFFGAVRLPAGSRRSRRASQPAAETRQPYCLSARAWPGRRADRHRLSICGAWRSSSALLPAKFPAKSRKHRPRRRRPSIIPTSESVRCCYFGRKCESCLPCIVYRNRVRQPWAIGLIYRWLSTNYDPLIIREALYVARIRRTKGRVAEKPSNSRLFRQEGPCP